jgi:TonB family protein
MIAANSSGPAIASKPAEPVSPMSPVKMESIPVISAAPPAAAFAPSVPRYVRRGGTVQPAQLLTNINPTYPVTAKQSGIAGSVEVHFKITNTGDVQNVVVVKGPQVLAQAAVDAVRERRYKPARVDGVPTETDASAIFDFKLN